MFCKGMKDRVLQLIWQMSQLGPHVVDVEQNTHLVEDRMDSLTTPIASKVVER